MFPAPTKVSEIPSAAGLSALGAKYALAIIEKVKIYLPSILAKSSKLSTRQQNSIRLKARIAARIESMTKADSDIEGSASPASPVSENLAGLISMFDAPRPAPTAARFLPATPIKTCPALYEFVFRIGAGLDPSEREQLWPFVSRLSGSKASPEVELARVFRFADWAVRKISWIPLSKIGLNAEAKRLRDHEPIVDRVSAERAYSIASGIYNDDTLIGVSASTGFAASAAHYAATIHTSPMYVSASAGSAARCAEIVASAAADRENILQLQIALLDELCPTSSPQISISAR